MKALKSIGKIAKKVEFWPLILAYAIIVVFFSLTSPYFFTVKNFMSITLYASIDDYKPAEQKAKPEDFSLMDKWVLSKLNTLVKFVDEGLEEYKITETARAIAAFTDELSNWYVRRSRRRFSKNDNKEDKMAAFHTLHSMLKLTAIILAPFTPFLSEELYQKIKDSLRSNDYESDQKFKSRKRAEYLERALYYCPNCNSFESLYSKGNYLYCKNCEMVAEYTLDLKIKAVDGVLPYSTVYEWYNAQKEKLKIAILNGCEIEFNQKGLKARLIYDKKWHGQGKVDFFANKQGFKVKTDKQKYAFDWQELDGVTVLGKKKINFYLPVLPKPPAPLAVSQSSSASCSVIIHFLRSLSSASSLAISS